MSLAERLPGVEVCCVWKADPLSDLPAPSVEMDFNTLNAAEDKPWIERRCIFCFRVITCVQQLDVSATEFKVLLLLFQRVCAAVRQWQQARVSPAGLDLLCVLGKISPREKGKRILWNSGEERSRLSVSDFSKPCLFKFSEMQKLVYRESDKPRSHQPTDGNTSNTRTVRVSICLFISVYLSSNHLTKILS